MGYVIQRLGICGLLLVSYMCAASVTCVGPVTWLTIYFIFILSANSEGATVFLEG
jgi:ABC-type Fe3+-siderophore transport system permease subunit